MKLPRLSKKWIIAPVVAAAVITGGVVYAFQSPASEPEEITRHEIQADEKQELDTPEIAEVEELEEPTVLEEQPVEVIPLEEEKQENPFNWGLPEYHVFERRRDVGLTIPEGAYVTGRYCNTIDSALFNSKPRLHSVACRKYPTPGGTSVAVFVEKVNSDGTIWVSAMNSSGQKSMTDETPAGGFGVVSYSRDSQDIYNYLY